MNGMEKCEVQYILPPAAGATRHSPMQSRNWIYFVWLDWGIFHSISLLSQRKLRLIERKAAAGCRIERIENWLIFCLIHCSNFGN
jgi:hypothetical protein